MKEDKLFKMAIEKNMPDFDRVLKGCIVSADKKADHPKKSFTFKKLLPVSVCCVALIFTVFVSYVHNGLNTGLPYNSTVDLQNDNDTKDLQSDIDTKPENVVIINQLTEVSNEILEDETRLKQNICLLWDDCVWMTYDEICDYYGVNIFPTVPSSFKLWEPCPQDPYKDAVYSIFKGDGGVGEVYYDTNVINYSDDEHNKNINIEVSKGQYPFSCYAVFELEEFEVSLINGNDVYIFKSATGYYHAQFMYNNVGFRIITNDLLEDELIKVIESIVV